MTENIIMLVLSLLAMAGLVATCIVFRRHLRRIEFESWGAVPDREGWRESLRRYRDRRKRHVLTS